MPKVNFVKKARKDVKGTDIKKGESYYWWKFRFGSKISSRTQPRQSQLTQSDFLSQIYEIQERIEDMTIEDDFESEVSDIVSELENLQSECEDKISNMPDQLQSAPTGELLQNRADSIQEMIDELEGIDKEVDEESIKADLDKDDDKEEAIEDRKQEILEEIQNVSYNGE